MKTFIWKFRCARHFRRIAFVSWHLAWQVAEAQMEMVKGDVTECPIEAARSEFEQWEQDA